MNRTPTEMPESGAKIKSENAFENRREVITV
jgi:hypothetical protein